MRPANHSHSKKHKDESFTARAVNTHKISRSGYENKKQQSVTFTHKLLHASVKLHDKDEN